MSAPQPSAALMAPITWTPMWQPRIDEAEKAIKAQQATLRQWERQVHGSNRYFDQPVAGNGSGKAGTGIY